MSFSIIPRWLIVLFVIAVFVLVGNLLHIWSLHFSFGL